MSKSAILSVKILADATKAKAGLDSAAGEVDKFEKSAGNSLKNWESHLNKATAAMSAVSAGVIALGKQSFDAASSLQQSTGAVESVFKHQAEQVKAFSEAASQAVGLSKNQYNELASVLGAQLKNIGIEQEQVVGKTNDLIEKGADLAATFGGTTADAVSALSALMRGERDPIERYGVSIKQATIEAKLAEMGLKGLEGEAKTAAETQATLALLNEQTADSFGQFSREADTAAGAQQRATAEWENAKAALGEELLPVISDIAIHLADAARWLSEHTELAQFAAGAVLGLTGALLGLKAATTVVNILTAAQASLNLTMLANPYVAVAAAVVALVAVIVNLYRNNESFRESIQALGNFLKNAFIGIMSEVVRWIEIIANAFINPQRAIQLFAETADKYLNWITNALANVQKWLDVVANHGSGPGKWIAKGFSWAIDKIRDFIEWIRSALDWVRSFNRTSFKGGHRGGVFAARDVDMTMIADSSGLLTFARSAPDITAAYSPTSLSGISGALSTSGISTINRPVINITVNGAVDAESTARQIAELLDRERNRQSW